MTSGGGRWAARNRYIVDIGCLHDAQLRGDWGSHTVAVDVSSRCPGFGATNNKEDGETLHFVSCFRFTRPSCLLLSNTRSDTRSTFPDRVLCVHIGPCTPCSLQVITRHCVHMPDNVEDSIRNDACMHAANRLYRSGWTTPQPHAHTSKM